MSGKPYFVVVGGCNFDMYAIPDKPLLEADSNPGKVFTAPGGVGRNIAENLARLGSSVTMLTALGTDAFGDAIVRHAESAGLDFSNALRLPHASTSVYVCINKHDGDIAVAVSDMDISQQITPEYLQSCRGVLERASLVIADTNLSPEALVYLAEHYGAKLCVDSVSTAKSQKLLPILSHLYCIKANRSEAACVSGVEIKTTKDAAVAAQKLHTIGIPWVMITLGEDGAYLSNEKQSFCMPLMPGETANTSGCGDAFFAGAIIALAENRPVNETLRYGLVMARLCAASPSAVSPMVSRKELENTLQKYQGGAWQ